MGQYQTLINSIATVLWFTSCWALASPVVLPTIQTLLTLAAGDNRLTPDNTIAPSLPRPHTHLMLRRHLHRRPFAAALHPYSPRSHSALSTRVGRAAI
jgi:hypothetical protein